MQDSVHTLVSSFTLCKILCSIQKQIQCRGIWVFYMYISAQGFGQFSKLSADCICVIVA